MPLEKLLSPKKALILKRWFSLMAQTYPQELSRLLQNEDQFTNPVGHTLSCEIEALYEELLQERLRVEKVSPSLDSIIKIMAIQGFSPALAVAFIFLLKKGMREELESEIEKEKLFGEWLNLESRIDQMASLAFDLYMKSREKIYELRVNEVKAEKERAFKLLGFMTGAGRKRGEVTE